MKLIKVLTLILALILIVAPLLVARPAFAQPESAYTVQPVAIAPLINNNVSIYGLDVPATPLAVGDNFTVQIHLVNATGVSGVEVHFFFGNILSYAVPTGYIDELPTGGALTGPASKLLYGISAGFYAADGVTPVSGPPYTGAEYYAVAAASTGAPIDVTNGLVAEIMFQITAQPTATVGDQFLPLTLTSDSIVATSTQGPDIEGMLTLRAPPLPPGQQQYTLTVNVVGNGTVTVSPQSATYLSGTVVTLTAIPESVNFTLSAWSGDITGTQNPINVTMDGNKTVTATFRVAVYGIPGDLNHDGVVNLQDLVLFASVYGLKKGEPGFIPEADLANQGVINLVDLVTFAVTYGKNLH